ncbi:MAG: hypothetical protein HQL56_09890 [Magnetococcales bacterium]|nr:hypothetical protein [Magnetococcales bacterium]
MVERLVWLVPLLPWLAAMWIGLGFLSGKLRGEASEKTCARIASWGIGLPLLLLLVFDLRALYAGEPGQIVVGTWISSGTYRVSVSFLLDRLGLSMATLMAVGLWLTARFSVNYLHREPGFQRFFAILCLFAGAMLLLTLSGNALLAFVGWEVAGVASFLLIGYAYDRATATGNATRALVTNRFGDAGFLVGITLSFLWMGGIEWEEIFAKVGRVDSLHVGLVAAGFILAAMAKSGQIPFAAWIGRALEGPTPSSAVFYGSLMVHAGVFLLLRLEPLLVKSVAMMGLLLVLGGLSMLYGLLVGLVQSDVKSLLMASTQAQVGFMVLLCGLGLFDVAAWYLAGHALWRLVHFLLAPSYMHLVAGPARPVPRWLSGQERLFTAALQRFWLDHLAETLLTRPTLALARDLLTFDVQVVARIVGRPLGKELLHTGQGGDGLDPLRVHGLAGRLLERSATICHWVEVNLILPSGGDGMIAMLGRLGARLALIDRLLERPRYLILLLVLTFVVVL